MRFVGAACVGMILLGLGAFRMSAGPQAPDVRAAGGGPDAPLAVPAGPLAASPDEPPDVVPAVVAEGDDGASSSGAEADRREHALHPMTIGVIIETGFLTSARDRRVIVDAPERAARGIVEAVVAFPETPAPDALAPAEATGATGR